MAALGNRFFVRRILERSGKVIAAFSGHTHFFYEQVVKGISYCTVPSFSESNGAPIPQGEYIIVHIDDEHISLELRRIEK